MRLAFAALLSLLALPALAQLQFDSKSAPSHASAPAATATPALPAAVQPKPPAGSGIAWLQKTPMTLFDLGMMELTNTANRLGEGTDGIQGAVAELQEDKNIISIGFYSAMSFKAESCLDLAQRLREALFLQRANRENLRHEVASYFVSYGPLDLARPRSVGDELIEMIRITVYQQGGVCQLPLANDKAEVTPDASTSPTPAAKP